MDFHISLWYLPRPVTLLIVTPITEILTNFRQLLLLLSFESWRSSPGLQFLVNFYFSSFPPLSFLFFHSLLTESGTAVAQWLRCCATNRKIAGSIPDGVIGIFY